MIPIETRDTCEVCGTAYTECPHAACPTCKEPGSIILRYVAGQKLGSQDFKDGKPSVPPQGSTPLIMGYIQGYQTAKDVRDLKVRTTTNTTDTLAQLRKCIEEGDAVADSIPGKSEPLIGSPVVISTYDIGGKRFEAIGTLVRIEKYAQYEWSLVVLPPRKRRHGQRFLPGKVLDIRPLERK